MKVWVVRKHTFDGVTDIMHIKNRNDAEKAASYYTKLNKINNSSPSASR